MSHIGPTLHCEALLIYKLQAPCTSEITGNPMFGSNNSRKSARANQQATP